MTDFRELYAAKRMSAEALASQVCDGWVVGTDAALAEPVAFLAALAGRARKGELSGVTVQTLLDAYPLDLYADPALFGKLTGVSWFSSGGARKAINEGRADFIPNYYRDIPRHIRANYRYDAFCISVSPMDSHGYFSLGATCSYSPAMIEKAERIYVEVNACQPRAVCGAQLHISQVDAVIEHDQELPVLAAPQLDELILSIGG